MYAAFNTLQLELERLLLLRESITTCGQSQKHTAKLSELNRNIYSHEKGISLIVAAHQKETATLKRANVVLLEGLKH